MEEKLVSILIPVYNRVNLVGETIDSAINQTYKNIEIIIVDNCSNDGTWELLKQYVLIDNRIRIFRNDENIGPVRNWKRCVSEAKGDFAKLLFSDDLIKRKYIEETIKIFDENTSFVLTGFEMFNKKQIIYKSNFQKNLIISTSTYLSSVLIINKQVFPNSPGCAIFRRIDLQKNIIEEIPNSDNLKFSKYGAGNDLLIFLLTANDQKYMHVKCTNMILARFRNHNDSITVKRNEKLNIYYLYCKYYFITRFYEKETKKFKSILFMEYITNRKQYKELYNQMIKSPISLKVILKIIYERIKSIIIFPYHSILLKLNIPI